MNWPIVTLKVIEEEEVKTYAATLSSGWVYAWMRLTESGRIALVEIHTLGDWAFASTDFIDEKLFKDILRDDPDHYGGMDFPTFQGNVLSSMVRNGLVTKEARPLAYCDILDPPIRE